MAKDEVKTVEVEKLRKVLKQYQDDIYDTNSEVDKNKLGKILTIIDGAFGDETQRKAVKDMINEVWYRPVEQIGRTYPSMYMVTEALGFALYIDNHPQSIIENRHNPYKELAK